MSQNADQLQMMQIVDYAKVWDILVVLDSSGELCRCKGLINLQKQLWNNKAYAQLR